MKRLTSGIKSILPQLVRTINPIRNKLFNLKCLVEADKPCTEYEGLIHYVWTSIQNIPCPYNYQKKIKQTKVIYPNARFMFWDNKRIDNFLSSGKMNSSYKEQYYKINKSIMRADFIRYLIVYYYGGIYSDFNVVHVKCIPFEENEVLFCEAILSDGLREGTSLYKIRQYANKKHKYPLKECKKRIYNGVFYSKSAFNYIIKLFIEESMFRLKNYSYKITDSYDVIFLTGPDVVSHVIDRIEYNNVYDDIYFRKNRFEQSSWRSSFEL